MSKADLRRELDTVVAELNSKDTRPDDCYQYDIGTHAGGLAIDISKDGEAPNKVLGQFVRAAMEAGYVATATLVHDDSSSRDYTRIFLGEADDYFDLGPSVEELREAAIEEAEQERAIEEAREEGFLAGLFFAGLLSFIDVEADDEDLFDGLSAGDVARGE